MLRRLSLDPCDSQAVQSLLDMHLWIVEEELRMCIGRPLWFDSALSFLVAKVVRDFARNKVSRNCSAHWIRGRARRASQNLERTLSTRHVRDGIMRFTDDETFECIVGSVLERKRSLYWEKFRLPKSRSRYCGPSEGSD